jgi:hypothetical protein
MSVPKTPTQAQPQVSDSARAEFARSGVPETHVFATEARQGL